ncbi:MAG: hypothetical protein LC804_01470 [Acidobacteria bacterium]|nr:hypothetical protein [Acidobacteriota bacterium]
MVFKQTAQLTAFGLALGLPAAWIATRLLQGASGGETADAATLIAVSALVIAISFAAAWLPARRAVAIVPMQAVRHE